jgi:aminoglycoside 6'-N-acetyltransferase I
MAVQIKQVKRDDEALFDRVAEEVFDEPVDPQRLAAYLAEPGHLMLAAIDDGLIVAQCAAVVHRHPDKVTELYIDEVGVSREWQRQGIARKMLDRMFALGKSLGCGEAWVSTEPDNVPARRLTKIAAVKRKTSSCMSMICSVYASFRQRRPKMVMHIWRRGQIHPLCRRFWSPQTILSSDFNHLYDFGKILLSPPFAASRIIRVTALMGTGSGGGASGGRRCPGRPRNGSAV